MSNDTFFDEAADQSVVKATLVSKYFRSWAKVIIGYLKTQRGDGRIAYIDLFAGPGRYADGTKSTPILVLEQAIADTEIRSRLVTIFNDKHTNHSKSLETVLQSLPD